MAEQEKAAVKQAIKDQGEIVRKLKAEKAEKEKVRFDIPSVRWCFKFKLVI